jgi:hypothetical protein
MISILLITQLYYITVLLFYQLNYFFNKNKLWVNNARGAMKNEGLGVFENGCLQINRCLCTIVPLLLLLYAF